MNAVKEAIKMKASLLGFSSCGFARAQPLQDLRIFYSEFVSREQIPGLSYLYSQFEKRLDPRLIMKDAVSVICVMMNYYPPETISPENNFIISRYAYGKDYHIIMKERMAALTGFLRKESPGVNARSFVDSGPLLEKAWALRCGVGWQGKNTLIIRPGKGSFFFIGILLTNLELEPDLPASTHCGECDRCMKACPTGALDTPYRLDISRCIAYWTIEKNRGIPVEIRHKLNGRIFGCDICQEVCPHNRYATGHHEPEFLPSSELRNLRKEDWMKLSEEDFVRIFSVSPVRRTGYDRFIYNIMAGL